MPNLSILLPNLSFFLRIEHFSRGPQRLGGRKKASRGTWHRKLKTMKERICSFAQRLRPMTNETCIYDRKRNGKKEKETKPERGEKRLTYLLFLLLDATCKKSWVNVWTSLWFPEPRGLGAIFQGEGLGRGGIWEMAVSGPPMSMTFGNWGTLLCTQVFKTHNLVMALDVIFLL